MTGCLVTAVVAVFGGLLLIAAGAAAVADLGLPATVVVASMLAGFLALHARRRRRRRAVRARRRAERAQRRTAHIERCVPWASSPITDASPLPRTWRAERDTAGRACRDYAAAVAAMTPGPVRDRLAGQQEAVETASLHIDALARRAAELDRQLATLPRPARGSPHAAALRATVGQAREQLRRGATDMAVLAAQAAHVAMTLSLSDADDVAAAVGDLRSTVGGVAAAVHDLRSVERQTARS